MTQLTGINLGQRQHELNKKVDNLFTKKESFEQIPEKSDIDRLIKIDLANLHKNVNYLIDILKCGDPLYISRALKCTSLYEDHNVINPDYVHHNIIPFMSQKMKRKMLTAIATQIKDQKILDSFYEYCLKQKLHGNAYKFLINASTRCKEEYLKSVTDIDDSIKFEFFFDNNYDLINHYIEKKKVDNGYLANDLFRFCYLFSSSSEKYLNMLENCLEKEKCTYYNSHKKFGLRMSKIVLTKHKQRVMEKPWLYLGVLDKGMITRYITSEDAKKYAASLLPDKCDEFWYSNFYTSYAFILDKIPAKELYKFLKNIFNTKYPNELFEMNFSFYEFHYHRFMTAEERHNWALKHIEEKKEHFGPLRDYKWYEYVKFSDAFLEIKKLIMVSKPTDIRLDLIEVLVKSASQEDMETLLSYYYERHINEPSFQKCRFIDCIIETHNIYEFDAKTWALFMKLLHSIQAFAPNQNSSYSFVAVVYNIIVYKTIPQSLEAFCSFGRSFCESKAFKKINAEKKQFVYNYLKEYFTNKIKELMDTNAEKLQEENLKAELIHVINSLITLITSLGQFKQDFPEVAMKGVELYWDYFKHNSLFASDRNRLTEGDLLRLLKKDKKLLLERFPTDKEYDIRCTTVVKKVKIYFNDDLAKNMIDFYEKKMLDLLGKREGYHNFNSIIFNLIQLSDTEFKTKLMTEYAPVSSKIAHDEIDRNLLGIQESICRFVHTSRPPVPLSSVQMYLKGDYVPFCLLLFSSYAANLPLSASIKFIESMLDSPVSIQKHGLRLAFEAYGIDNLTEIMTKIWKRTKNTSLRWVIFKAMINKIAHVCDSDQIKLYEALKLFISTLRVDDSQDIYNLLSSTRLPEKLFSDFLEEAWNAVDRLPLDSKVYIDDRRAVVNHMANSLEEIDRNIVNILIKGHISTMFEEKQILEHDNSYNISELYQAKWNLIARYITHFDNDQELGSSLELLQKIMKVCLDMWSEIKINSMKQPHFVVRHFLHDFLCSIQHNVPYKRERDQKTLVNPIFQSIVQFFERHLPINFVFIFDFKLTILFRNVVGDGKLDVDTGIMSYKHLDNETVAKGMSKGIVDLVREQYCPSLSKHIADVITANIEEITNQTDLNHHQLTMAVCRYLSGESMYELRLLALHMIPIQMYQEYSDDFNAITHNIISSDDYDLKRFLYQQFIYCDFVNRIPQLM